ncbi:hypothetical protein DPMN_115501 [Dreissena polymorpha]|uniref:Uncharacterized protein n=1 Tax=Dreissena polymorpha TaxID=45954 RepID=A0A9D4KM22_DREPO|nr:hypothetical protein DPMN_115501 [Dreissena polymorpha]
MVHSTNNTSSDITMNGEKLEEVTSFKYFCATLSQDSTSTTEIRIRLQQRPDSAGCWHAVISASQPSTVS